MLVLLLTFVFSCLLLLLSNSKSWSRDNAILFASSSRQEFACLPTSFFPARRRLLLLLLSTPLLMPSSSKKKKRAAAQASAGEHANQPPPYSVLDLPELVIDCILAKLPPTELRSMAAVCCSMRERCRSDRLWGPHMAAKWGRVLGPAARRAWKVYLASARKAPVRAPGGGAGRRRRWLAALSCVCPVSWIRSRMDGGSDSGESASPVPDGSVMSWYLSMESGKLWLPAQVYNREHGHVGFVLSCYDAELSYDFHTDTFCARYPPHGRRTVVLEDGVQWDRVRAPPVDTLAHDLHVSDCLHDLRPGNHIEIQWRRNKAFPYGWWYGVVGHLESCDGDGHFCRCHLSDTVVLEFNQYTPGSRWRQTLINRKENHEEGNETDGFYGGIRKLGSEEEICKWRQLWPREVLE